MYRIAVLASSQIFPSVFKPRTCRASSLKYRAKIPGVKTVADQSGRKIGGQYPEIANHHFITGMEEENEMKNWELTFGISLFETLSFQEGLQRSFPRNSCMHPERRLTKKNYTMYTISTQLLLFYRANADTVRNDSYILRQRGIGAVKRVGKRRMYSTYGRSKSGAFEHEMG